MPGGLSGEPLAAFRGVRLLERRLAVSRVLLHIGQAEAAREGLLRTAGSHRRDPQIQLRIADALVMLQQRPAALRRCARAAALAVDPGTRASALLGSAHTRANGAEYGAALRDLNEAHGLASKIPDPRSRHNQQAWIAALQARIHAVTDDEDSAIRSYREVAALAGRTRNLDLRTTALVFGSDLLRSRGLYHRALAMLALVFEDNELYGRPYTRVWGHFYRGETLCAMGHLAEGLADLESCRESARLNANHQAMAWASLVLASYRRCHDLGSAQQAITDCEDAMAAYGRDMLLCDVRLAWERAELARHAAKPTRPCARSPPCVNASPAHHFPRNCPTCPRTCWLKKAKRPATKAIKPHLPSSNMPATCMPRENGITTSPGWM